MELHEAREALDRLVKQGHLDIVEMGRELRYRTSLARKFPHEAPFNIWEDLGSKLE